jgi:hypothetical protein
MTDWASGLVRKGVWSADDFEEFRIMGGTAQGMKALQKVRNYYGDKTIPVDVGPAAGAPSKDELMQWSESQNIRVIRRIVPRLRSSLSKPMATKNTQQSNQLRGLFTALAFSYTIPIDRYPHCGLFDPLGGVAYMPKPQPF